jgi:hypothetical protein
MDACEEPSRYGIPLERVEHAARVPLEEQVIEQAANPAALPASDWDEDRRQARLAGGA